MQQVKNLLYSSDAIGLPQETFQLSLRFGNWVFQAETVKTRPEGWGDRIALGLDLLLIY